MAESIPYVFQCINNASTKELKKNILLQYGNNLIKQILYYAFHPDVKFDLPEGMPPYNFRGYAEAYPKTLYPRIRQLRVFLEGEYQNLPKMKKELLFVQLLEDIHPDEGKILCAMKDKSLNKLYDGLDYQLVKEVYPDLNLPEEKTKDAEEIKLVEQDSSSKDKKTGKSNSKTSRTKTT